jgi:ribose 1,5-bisphosphokinase
MSTPAPTDPGEQGLFIAVVGPSGVGKDTIIRGLRDILPASHFFFPHRIITREPDHHEENQFLDREGFNAALEKGEFALAWEANGLAYALPRDIWTALRAGKHVIVNLSRAVVPKARALFPRTLVVHVTARPDVIEARLRERGRESSTVLAERFARGQMLDAKIEADLLIENNGKPEESIGRLGSLLIAMTYPRNPTP